MNNFLFLLISFFLSKIFSELTGKEAYDKGFTLLQLGREQEASEAFWIAILKSTPQIKNTPSSSSLTTNNNINKEEYDLKIALEQFMGTYHRRKIPEYGLLKIGKQFKLQGFEKEAIEYLQTVIKINSKLVEPYLLLGSMQSIEPNIRLKYMINALMIDPDGYHTNFEVASQLWDLRAWESSLAYFERAYQLNNSCHSSLSTSIYLRQYICKWGPRGSQYYADNKIVTQLIQEELHMLEDGSENGVSAVTVHPHMTLGYHIPAELKLQVAKSHAIAEKELVKQSIAPIYTHKPAYYRNLTDDPSFRIKIGYVSANIKSKTTVYMAQDLFRFHNRTKFEVHVYATTPNDSDYFLEHAMGGVDWRAKIRNTVEYFHDMSGQNILTLANQIRNDGIHILLNWDGYSNNGVRPAGLFPMQTAPIQVAHQEYIGTMGADYIQYIITDVVTTPPRLSSLYTEKFIYLPHCFLANSMPYLSPHINPPTLTRPPGSDPKQNGCGGEPVEFVYCNFNKHLKFSPDTFMGWLNVLEEVPGSILCLLENPTDSKKNLLHFTEEYNSSLVNRIRFQPFVASPFENQKRVHDMCHVVLDTPVYNGHTTAADALWGGVPIVVYGNGVDMAGRVGHSIMTTLGLPELIAQTQENFVGIAMRLGNDQPFFRSIRSRLIHTVYQTNPKNPFWDLESYVRNLEKGFDLIWKNFVAGKKPKTVHVIADKISTIPKIYAQNNAENIYLKLNTTVNFFPKYSYNYYEKKIPALNRTQQFTLSDINKLSEKVLVDLDKFIQESNIVYTTKASNPKHDPSTAMPKLGPKSAQTYHEEWKAKHKVFQQSEEEFRRLIKEKQHKQIEQYRREALEKVEKLKKEFQQLTTPPPTEKKEKKEENVAQNRDEICTNPVQVIKIHAP